MLRRIFQKMFVRFFSPQFFLSVSFENKPNKFFTVPIYLKRSKLFHGKFPEQPRIHGKFPWTAENSWKVPMNSREWHISDLFQPLRLLYDLFSHNPAHKPQCDIAVGDSWPNYESNVVVDRMVYHFSQLTKSQFQQYFRCFTAKYSPYRPSLHFITESIWPQTFW